MKNDIETAKEFTRQMNRLAKLLGRNFENSIHGDEEKLQTYREYWNFLEIYELDVVKKAIAECLQQDTFWPKPARLIKLCEEELFRRRQEFAKRRTIESEESREYHAELAFQKDLKSLNPEQYKNYMAEKLENDTKKRNTVH
jgi:hypothetical protein